MMSPSPFLLVAGADRLTIEIRGLLYPNHRDLENRMWLDATIAASIGAFQCSVRASLRLDEFKEFERSLRALLATQQGEAVYSAMEAWLDLVIRFDESGQLVAIGTIQDRPGIGNQLSFEMSLTLEEILKAQNSLAGLLGGI